MSVSSDGIWFPIATNHQSHSCHQQPTDDQPGDNSQPINSAGNIQAIINPNETTSRQPVANHGLPDHPGYQSPIWSRTKADMVDGYTEMVTARVRAGWSCHLVTILFSQLPGPRSAVIDHMRDEVRRVYSTLLTRVHRKPRKATVDELPVLVAALDLPVYKRDKASGPMVLCNGGLHFHALMMMPPTSRLKELPAAHFQKNRHLYAGTGRSVQRIHVQPVVEDHGRVVDYVLKTVFNGRLSYDEAVVVLPRSRGELDRVSHYRLRLGRILEGSRR